MESGNVFKEIKSWNGRVESRITPSLQTSGDGEMKELSMVRSRSSPF